MGDQLISYHKENSTPERFPDQASPRRKHSLEKKAPLQMFKNRYQEYVKHVEKSIPIYLFENSKDFRPKSGSLIPAKHIKHCTAFKLSAILIEMSSKQFTNIASGEEEFLQRCINCIEDAGILRHIEDIELLIIYIQQMQAIVKESGIADLPDNSTNALKTQNSYSRQYIKLFSAFWNKVKWDDIFLSMPEFAARLQAAKEAMIGIILKMKGQFRLDSAANKFLKTTGLGKESDLYLISFLDFYFFTWLSHFGLINYLDGNDDEPVMIEVTEYGRIFLEAL